MVRTSGIPVRTLSWTTITQTIKTFFTLHADHLNHFWRGGMTVIIVMMVGKLISVGWKLLIVRLGPETLGTTQLILTALTLLSSFSLFGMQTSLGRFASIAWRQRRYVRAKQLLVTSLKWCGVVSLIFAISCWLWPEVTKSLLKLPAVGTEDLQYLGFAIPFAIGSELAWSYLAAQRKILLYGVTRYLVLPITRLGLLGLLMTTQLPVTQVIVWHLVGAVVITALITWIAGSLPTSLQSAPLPKALGRRFLKYSASIGASFLLFMVYGSTDVLLLSHFSTLEQVGLLSALFIFTELLDVFFTGFLNIFQSFLSSFHKDPVTGLKFTLLTAGGLLLGGLGITAILLLVRGPVISLLLGPEYQVIGSVLGLALLLKTIESSLVFSLHHYLDFYGYVKVTIGLMLIGLVIKLGLGWWLIARYALAGVYYTQAFTIAVEIICCFVVIGVVIISRRPRFKSVQRWLRLD